MNSSAAAVAAELVAAALVTVTSTVPSVWARVTAVIWVSESTVNQDAAVPPKYTPVAVLKSRG